MAEGSGNCGLPDGVIHLHSERCYQAGRKAGAAEAVAGLSDVSRFVRMMTDSVSVDRAEMARDILAIAEQGGVKL